MPKRAFLHCLHDTGKSLRSRMKTPPGTATGVNLQQSVLFQREILEGNHANA